MKGARFSCRKKTKPYKVKMSDIMATYLGRLFLAINLISSPTNSPSVPHCWSQVYSVDLFSPDLLESSSMYRFFSRKRRLFPYESIARSSGMNASQG